MTNEEAINNLYELKTYLLYHPIDFKGHISLPISLIDYSIESLKSQKTGHWIENAPEWQNIDTPYICSECGNSHLRKTNYCDQCGAKMRGE